LAVDHLMPCHAAVEKYQKYPPPGASATAARGIDPTGQDE
jgi:hypothetical protein